MTKISLTPELRNEYQHLFDTCLIRPAHAAEVEKTAAAIAANQQRYAAVGVPLGIPWFFVGVIHCLEASLKFTTHLHNGDPLTKRTTHVPKGRPAAPPADGVRYTWEESATDALTIENFANLSDWSLPAILYRLEAYNGFGYRSRGINTPYLWSFSTHYSQGKFAEDGVFSPVLVSQQCGAAVLIRRMAEKGIIQFDAANAASDEPLDALASAVVFDPNHETAPAAHLQQALNHIPGISLAVDGVAGKRTSDAVHAITGHFLQGDPRA
jgi:lysozyme family protein